MSFRKKTWSDTMSRLLPAAIDNIPRKNQRVLLQDRSIDGLDDVAVHVLDRLKRTVAPTMVRGYDKRNRGY